MKISKVFQSVVFLLAALLLLFVVGSSDQVQAADPTDEQLAKPVVQHNFQKEVLYFLIPDRFWDGNTTNNCGGYVTPCVITDTVTNTMKSGYLPTDTGFYHGGDLKGLQAKLGYLQNMGVTAIWVGPIFKNQPTQGDKPGGSGSSGYHGYWITDFTTVDPHLGTNQDFKDLITAAHAKGIKVFMDIITNHTGDIITHDGADVYRGKTKYPYKDATGKEFDDVAYTYRGQTDYAFPTLSIANFPYPPVLSDANKDIKIPAWLNDPLLYHNRGSIGDWGAGTEAPQYGDFVGLDDLFTEKKEVVQGMIDIYKYWIKEFKPDGFRIDTVKHVNMEFWQQFGPAIIAEAKTQGIADFLAFGEVYETGTAADQGAYLVSEFSTRGKLQADVDFNFQVAARGFASQGQATNVLKTFFEKDDYYTDADSNASFSPTFLGNHDMGRMGFFLQTDNPKATDAELVARDKLAHALMFLSRGQPVVYYGDEQGFTGAGGDKAARADMFPSLAPLHNDDVLIGTTKTPADDNFDPTHPLYKALKEYAQVRNENKALQFGAMIQRYSSDKPGVYAFSRIDRDEKVEYIIALNNTVPSTNTVTTAQSFEITVPTFYPDTTVANFEVVYDSQVGLPNEIYLPLVLRSGAVTSTTKTTTVAAAAPRSKLTASANGQVTISVPPLGFVIYKATKPVAASAAAPDVTITNLKNSQALTLPITYPFGHKITQRIEVDAKLGMDNVFAEVTFAVKVGNGTYQVIGTDDNPPYRIFYNVADLPISSTLSFKAIVNDLNGHYKSSEVTGITYVTQEPVVPPPSKSIYDHVVIHYVRPTGDYSDTTGYWGLHFWGSGLAEGEAASVSWGTPRQFYGQDDYGRFTSIKLADDALDVSFIVHKGDVKDGSNADRSFNPRSSSPEIWLKQDDGNFYTSQATAQGYATVHYKRADGKYDGWGLHLWGDGLGAGVGTDWSKPRLATGTDDFGAYYRIPLSDTTKAVNFIIHNGNNKDPGSDQLLKPSETANVWIMSGKDKLYTQRGAAENKVTLHYRRTEGDYGDTTTTSYWGLHGWGDTTDSFNWASPMKPAGTDAFGIYFTVNLTTTAKQFSYIFHQGDTKDPGPDQSLDITTYGYEIWQLQGADVAKPFVLPIIKAKGDVAGGDLSTAKAHWLTADTIAWPIEYDANYSYVLYSDLTAGVTLDKGKLTGGQATSVTLTVDTAGLSTALKTQYPHVAGAKALSVLKLSATDAAKAGNILKGKFFIVKQNKESGLIVNATSLQIAGVLDSLYTYTNDLGVIWNSGVPTLRVWAPTAKSVMLHLYADSTTTVSETVQMVAGEKGTWSVVGTADWKNKYYLYGIDVYAPSSSKIEHNIVTDPYAISLSMNSTRSQIVDLNDAALLPANWNTVTKTVAAPEDIVLYELHVRDFSAEDAAIPTNEKGTFKAFANPASNGMKHLKKLADAGLTHIHLLPVFDIVTINEDKSTWLSPTIPATATAASLAQQAAVGLVREKDGFNWGYDPFNYFVPEGSYSTSPDGSTRILEFRQMVKALSDNGLRVVMDVVYNHTNTRARANLDGVVPGYYYRLDSIGSAVTDTCGGSCPGVATENVMVEKLMIDSLKTWVTAYKVNGFRFDLMGFHTKSNMQKIQSTLQAIDPSVYLYGEGWTPWGGEETGVNARGEYATQLTLGNTGIGTFNDRIRDAVRGGAYNTSEAGDDGLMVQQGFINGLYYDPNAFVLASKTMTETARKNKLLLSADQIMVSLAGNLADYQLVDRTGVVTTGKNVDYNGAPSGYTKDPQEHIAYAESHDNRPLYDISQYKIPTNTVMADRVRIQNLGLDIVALSQGIPFFQAGMDMLRSKSMDNDSYDSGDWYNAIDFTYETNKWGVGLPGGWHTPNQNNWANSIMFLANPALKPTKADVVSTLSHFQEMLQIRKSSPLFRLRTADQINSMVKFHNTGPNQVPGLIVMSIDGTGLIVGAKYTKIVVLFNANDEAQTFAIDSFKDKDMYLHPIQANGSDAVVKTSTYNKATGTFSVPGRTTAVFVDVATPNRQILGYQRKSVR